MLQKRKQSHLDICLNRSLMVESGSTGLSGISLYHRSLPETDVDSLSLQTPFLGYTLQMPLMISCMTGGSEEGLRLNRLLAQAAGEHGLAFGTGSVRVMLRHPETSTHFMLKELAPDVPVIANIGAAQLTEYTPQQLTEAVRRIQADALYVHLNPAQELFQTGGDRNFRLWYDGIHRLTDHAPFPVLVKETGCGIPPFEGLRLLDAGVSFVDLAGAGGTDWIAVESLCAGGNAAADSFRGWGYPTAELLLAYREIVQGKGVQTAVCENKFIASGGLRTPLDFAVSLACGAWLAAAALPFIRLAAEGGPEAVASYIKQAARGIRAAMALTGSADLTAFRKSELRIKPELHKSAVRLSEYTLGF